jgi:RNA-directed DNA polymerase
MLKTPEQIQELRKKLYHKAKQEKEFRFYALYDKVYRQDTIDFACHYVKSNKGAPGIDGVTFKTIEGMEGGAKRYCEALIEELKNKTYKPMPVKRVYIPKPDGTKRPLGIPTIKDRIVQSGQDNNRTHI